MPLALLAANFRFRNCGASLHDNLGAIELKAVLYDELLAKVSINVWFAAR